MGDKDKKDEKKDDSLKELGTFGAQVGIKAGGKLASDVKDGKLGVETVKSVIEQTMDQCARKGLDAARAQAAELTIIEQIERADRISRRHGYAPELFDLLGAQVPPFAQPQDHAPWLKYDKKELDPLFLQELEGKKAVPSETVEHALHLEPTFGHGFKVSPHDCNVKLNADYMKMARLKNPLQYVKEVGASIGAEVEWKGDVLRLVAHAEGEGTFTAPADKPGLPKTIKDAEKGGEGKVSGGLNVEIGVNSYIKAAVGVSGSYGSNGDGSLSATVNVELGIEGRREQVQRAREILYAREKELEKEQKAAGKGR